MARLEVVETAGKTDCVVTLSRRNLLSLLHKLDMPESARELQTRDCWIDGKQTPISALRLILRCENDDEHYIDRRPGEMHPDTEDFVGRNYAPHH